MVVPPPDSGQDYNRLALDVASVIMGSFMKRSESITRVDENVNYVQISKGVSSKEASSVELAKERLKQFYEEQDRLLSSIEEKESKGLNQCSVKKLEELRALVAELVHEVSSIDDRPALDLSQDISHLRSLFDQLIDENLSLERACEEKDSRLQLHLQHEDSTDHIRDELQGQIDSLKSLLCGKEADIGDMVKDQVVLLRTVKEGFLALRLLSTELHQELVYADNVGRVDVGQFKEEVMEIFHLQRTEIEKLTAENITLNRTLSRKENDLAQSSALVEKLTADLLKADQDKQSRVLSLIEENEDIIRTLTTTNTRQLTELQQSYEDQLAEKDARCNQYNDQIVKLSEQLCKLEAELERMREEKKRMAEETTAKSATNSFGSNSFGGTPPNKRPRSNSITNSVTGTPGSTTGSSLKNIIPVAPAGQMRVVFTGYRDQTGPKSVKYLGGLVERLGGVVHVSDVFSEQITHVVSPKGCNSIKVLAGSLTAKWLVSEDWLIESANSGTFLPEINFSGRKHVDDRPFRGRTFYMTPAFQAQQLRHQFDVSCCRTLIENLGKGRLVRDSNSSVDYVLVADSEPTSSERITLKTFLCMIPGYCTESR